MNYGNIRQEALSNLDSYWVRMGIIWIIISFNSWALNYAISFQTRYSFLACFIIGGPFILGICRILMKIEKREHFEIKEILDGFREFSRSVTAFLLICFYVLVWSLLLVVPGIIELLSLSMTFFILAEDPEITPRAAMQKSRELMQGHKKELFYLTLSFIGWILIAFFICGLGFLLLNSYMGMAFLIFYRRISEQQKARERNRGLKRSIVLEGW